MRWLVRHGGKYIVLLAFLLCLGKIISIQDELSHLTQPVIYYEETARSYTSAAEMKSQSITTPQPISFTAVGEAGNISIINPDLNRTEAMQVIYLYGNSSVMIDSTAELLEDDTNGCLLSTAAAWTLFGSEQINGSTLQCDEISYLVRGVFDSEESVVILPAETFLKNHNTSDGSQTNSGTARGVLGNEGTGNGSSTDKDAWKSEGSFNKLILGVEGDASVTRLESIQTFETAAGLQTDKTDCASYVRISSILKMLIPIIILIILMAMTIKKAVSFRYKPFYCVGILFAGGILFAALFLICHVSFSVPGDMIPTRWSDFAFWSDKIETAVTGLRHIIFLDKSDIELAYFSPVVEQFVFTLAGIPLFALAFRLFKPCTLTQLFYMVVFGLMTAFIAILYLGSAGNSLVPFSMMIYLFPYYLAGYYLMRKSDGLSKET